MFPPERIVADRLVLRRPRMEDAQVIFDSYARDPEVTRYLGWATHDDVSVTESFLRRAIKAWDDGVGHRAWIMERKADKALLGTIGATVERHRVAVGYAVAREFWGNGYASEALRAVVSSALEDPRLSRIWALCDVDNPASARVMEKAGLRFEGVLRGYALHPNVSERPRDVRCHALVRGDV